MGYTKVQQDVAKLFGFDDIAIAFGDKCPEGGCVKKVGSDWRVISNKTGKLWPAKYKSEKDAKDALAAYHVARK